MELELEYGLAILAIIVFGAFLVWRASRKKTGGGTGGRAPKYQPPSDKK